jgi:hypothetical protein
MKISPILSILFAALVCFASCTKTVQSSCGLISTTSSLSISANSAILKWQHLSGSNSYIVKYRQTGTSSWISNVVTADSVQLFCLADSTLYEWQVGVACSLGTTFSPMASFYTLRAPATSISWTRGGITYVADSVNFDAVHGFIFAKQGANYLSDGSYINFALSPYPTSCINVYSTNADSMAHLIMTWGYASYGFTSNSVNNPSINISVSPAGKINLSIASIMMYPINAGGSPTPFYNISVHQ